MRKVIVAALTAAAAITLMGCTPDYLKAPPPAAKTTTTDTYYSPTGSTSSRYTRAAFGSPWTDDNTAPWGHNGCDTRNDALRHQLSGTTIKPGTNECKVMTGTLADPYTGRTIRYVRGGKSEVDVDHVVALRNAWVSGASAWTREKRVRFANDPINLQATDAATNRGKGDKSAAQWLPVSHAGACWYVARQRKIKATYGLASTRAERAAWDQTAATCQAHR